MFAGPLDKVFHEITKFGLRDAAVKYQKASEKYGFALPTPAEESVVVPRVSVWVYVGGGILLLGTVYLIFKD